MVAWLTASPVAGPSSKVCPIGALSQTVRTCKAHGLLPDTQCGPWLKGQILQCCLGWPHFLGVTPAHCISIKGDVLGVCFAYRILALEPSLPFSPRSPMSACASRCASLPPCVHCTHGVVPCFPDPGESSPWSREDRVHPLERGIKVEVGE
jgi:hypothetical protein